ncbi:hypothetical protein RB625_19680 [Streptomyces californicus]|uniref:hypothetical protein n=1 Tax=Streptomyces californicus TaxID=67351 RepID=UPI00296FB905|nr:hypothetical protein [Streptomyces californicus]MDW4900633.1 hypothetical protein [Streptomyces californicus]
MTTQPERLHHLLDRLLRDVLLPEEREQLAGAVRLLQARVNDQNGAADVAVRAVRLMNEAGAQRDAAEARVRELETKVARLTPNRTRYADIITTTYPALRYAADDIADHLARALETPPEATR